MSPILSLLCSAWKLYPRPIAVRVITYDVADNKDWHGCSISLSLVRFRTVCKFSLMGNNNFQRRIYIYVIGASVSFPSEADPVMLSENNGLLIIPPSTWRPRLMSRVLPTARLLSTGNGEENNTNI